MGKESTSKDDYFFALSKSNTIKVAGEVPAGIVG
jgi:hypothetical protein